MGSCPQVAPGGAGRGEDRQGLNSSAPGEKLLGRLDAAETRVQVHHWRAAVPRPYLSFPTCKMGEMISRTHPGFQGLYLGVVGAEQGGHPAEGRSPKVSQRRRHKVWAQGMGTGGS